MDSPPLSAVIFDLDGVISDTQRLHEEAELALLSAHNIRIAPGAFAAEFAGVSDSDMFKTLQARYSRFTISFDDFVARKKDKLEELLREGVPPVPGAISLVRRAASLGFRLAIASGSERSFIERVVRELGVDQHFHATVSSDEVANGKPAPDVFVEAARRVGAHPGECVVIEDGKNGMLAAVLAGMRCIGYAPNPYGWYPTNELVRSLHDITDDLLRGPRGKGGSTAAQSGA